MRFSIVYDVEIKGVYYMLSDGVDCPYSEFSADIALSGIVILKSPKYTYAFNEMTYYPTKGSISVNDLWRHEIYIKEDSEYIDMNPECVRLVDDIIEYIEKLDGYKSAYSEYLLNL